MLELPHTLVGAAIATKIPNPLISLPLALTSHILIDLVPHWNPSLYTETKKFGRPTKRSNQIVFWDTGLSLIAGFVVASRVLPDYYHFAIIVLACFMAVVPDVIEAPFFYLNYRPKFLKKLILWQHDHQGRAKPLPGLVVQLFTAALAILVIFS